MKAFRVKLLYQYKFIGQCLPIYAFYTILFIERGQSVTDVALLIALWSVFTIVFEIPSGVLADRWNRRNMLALSTVLQGLCYLIWSFAQTFWLFALGFAFWAIAGAFTSGTEEGLIYDNLKCDGDEDRFIEVYGKAQFYANIGTIAGLVAAGILVSFVPIGTIARISAVICFVNAFVVLQIREKNYYAEQLNQKTTAFWGTIQEVGVFIKGSSIAQISIVFLMLFASLGNYLDEFDALIIHDFQLGKVWISVMLTMRFLFIALGDVLAPVVEKRISSVRQIFLLNGLACLFLAGFAILWQPYALVIFALAFTVMTINKILLINTLQREIKEEGRATVMSFWGIGENLAMIGFSLVYAVLAGILPLPQVYFIIGIYGILGGMGFWLVCSLRKNHN